MTIVKEATGSKQQNLKQAAQIAHGEFNGESRCSLGLNRVVCSLQTSYYASMGSTGTLRTSYDLCASLPCRWRWRPSGPNL